ncbi:MAG: putative Ig domain-containing protein [Micrococcales bacterium]
MQITGFKNNARGLQKLSAIFAIISIVFFTIWVAKPSAAAISYGIEAKVYNNYTSSTGYRPMDNPSSVASYANYCTTTTLSEVRFTGGSFAGCGSDYILVHYHGYLYSATAQTLWFRGYSDDGIWFKVGNTVVVDSWILRGTPSWGYGTGTGNGVTFAAGEYKVIDGWFFEHGGGESSSLSYANNSSFSGEAYVPSSMFTLTNYQAVSFTDTTIDTQVTQGANYSANVGASGTGTVSYSLYSGELPPGIELNSSNGSLTGNPTTSGTYTFAIRASGNDGGATSSAISGNLSITVGTNTSLTSPLENQTLWIGDQFSGRVIFGGFPTPTVSRATGTLPPGMSVSSNGTLSGTATTGGNYSFKLRGTNFVDSTDSDTYTFYIEPAPTFSGSSDYGQTIDFGDSYSFTPNVVGNGISYSLVGDLPAGLTLNSQTGRISGTPTESGSYQFRVKAVNNSGNALSASSNLVVRKAPTFTSTSIATRITKGSNFSFDFGATGYPAPTYSYSGRLPAGLQLDQTSGVLSGRPTTGDSYTFTITATNAVSSVSVTKTVSVAQAPYAIDDTLALLLEVGRNYADAVEYGGFPNPTYEVVEGALPPGLQLNTATGAITGQPSSGGLYNFKVRAGNDAGTSSSNLFSLVVNQIPTKVDDVMVATADFGKPYTDGVSVSAYPLPNYVVKTGSLPPGLKLSPETGAITGTPTSTGVYAFTIEASNSLGALTMPGSITVQQAPVFVKVDFPATLNVGDSVSGKASASGFPSPIYSVSSGALPDGLSLNATTGEISGVTTNGGNYNFVISATNSVGSASYKAISVTVAGAETQIGVAAKIGDVVTGKTIDIAGTGLGVSVPYEVVLRSTPQVIAKGSTNDLGVVSEKAKIPGGLEPGWHSITLTSTKADGSTFEKAIYFQITETLMLEEISEVVPTEAQLAEALVNDPEFYAKMGIDPAATVTPAAAAAQVEQVTSVVASVALVSAAAAGAAAAASAAGGAASSAGGSSSSARSSGGSSGTRSGGTSSSSSSSSNGSSTDGKSDDGDGGDGGDYGNLEAEHDDFATEGAGVVDRLKVWQLPLMTWLDKPLVRWIETSAKYSPVLSRVLNDGSYLRALLGSPVALGYLSALTLGVAAVDPGANNLATSGRIGLLVAIMAFGTLDALFGILAMGAFVITSIITHHISTIADVRYLLAMFILGFAPSIMATTFRKIRRPAIENLDDAWERVIDLALIGFISVLTVMSLVGSVSAFAGATVPVSADVKPIAFLVATFAVGRVVLEELAAKLAPNRLDRINPTEVPETVFWQAWASLILKASVLVLMIGGMVGFGWHLWVGTFLIFLPSLIGMVFPNLPTVKWIHELIPGGVGALAFATLISSWSGQIVNSLLGKSELYGQLSFILIPLPVILIAIIGMFARQEEKLWQRANKKWLYIAGGIAVFVFTIQVTDFFPTIFG